MTFKVLVQGETTPINNKKKENDKRGMIGRGMTLGTSVCNHC
jgi:hypothetical protein